ncbi:MAG: CDF family Co(II)/Ni(II) efflux transporter DmeF [Gammaproteobacteria bacterium]|nr:CDF family Co(II)/Ni(II) efflux transporter DmeF [Gammaproteobacteria bacterium]
MHVAPSAYYYTGRRDPPQERLELGTSAASDDPLHRHDYGDVNPLAEQRTRLVALITVAMMVAELAVGWWSHSMALLADGWHMGTHAVALGLSAAAYALARRLQRDDRFAFGTWKIEILGGYTSAIVLFGVAATMAWESVVRLLHPLRVAFDEAILVALVGLAVNLLCAWLLAGAGGHAHHPGAEHEHAQGRSDGDPARRAAATAHHDLNLRSATVHVAADAATSVLALVALGGGKYLGAAWLDPVVGLVGSIVVAVWAVGLLRDTGRVLLDAEMDAPVVAEIRAALDRLGERITLQDLHVWRVGRAHYACMISLTTQAAIAPEQVRALLAGHPELVHVTVEVNRPGAPPLRMTEQA